MPGTSTRILALGPVHSSFGHHVGFAEELEDDRLPVYLSAPAELRINLKGSLLESGSLQVPFERVVRLLRSLSDREDDSEVDVAAADVWHPTLWQGVDEKRGASPPTR